MASGYRNLDEDQEVKCETVPQAAESGAETAPAPSCTACGLTVVEVLRAGWQYRPGHV